MKELNSRSENIKRNETPKCYESKTCWIEKISHTNYIVQKISIQITQYKDFKWYSEIIIWASQIIKVYKPWKMYQTGFKQYIL